MERNVIQIKSGIVTNADASVKKHICKKEYIRNPTTCSCKDGKYLASIIYDSAIICDEIKKTGTKTITTNFREKIRINCNTQKCYILLAFLLITMALLIGVSIYCYLLKCLVKQKHLSQLHIANNKLINEKLINVL